MTNHYETKKQLQIIAELIHFINFWISLGFLLEFLVKKVGRTGRLK